MKSANALAPQVAGMKKAMLRRSTWVTSAPWPRSRERKLDSLLGCRRPVRPFDLPPRLEDDDRPLEREREADLGKRAVAPTHGDHGVSRGDDGEVAGVPDPADHDVVEPRVRAGARLAGEDPDRRPACTLGASGGCGHHFAEPAGHDRRAPFREQTPDRLGPLLVLGAAADDRNLNRHAVTNAKTRPWQRNGLSSPSTSAARMSRR